MYDAPYRVELSKTVNNKTEYAIHHTSDGVLVYGTDLVFMHRVIDLLNAEENDKEGR